MSTHSKNHKATGLGVAGRAFVSQVCASPEDAPCALPLHTAHTQCLHWHLEQVGALCACWRVPRSHAHAAWLESAAFEQRTDLAEWRWQGRAVCLGKKGTTAAYLPCDPGPEQVGRMLSVSPGDYVQSNGCDSQGHRACMSVWSAPITAASSSRRIAAGVRHAHLEGVLKALQVQAQHWREAAYRHLFDSSLADLTPARIYDSACACMQVAAGVTLCQKLRSACFIFQASAGLHAGSVLQDAQRRCGIALPSCTAHTAHQAALGGSHTSHTPIAQRPQGSQAAQSDAGSPAASLSPGAGRWAGESCP